MKTMAEELSLKIKAFIILSATAITILSLVSALIIICITMCILYVAWYFALSIGLSVTHIDVDNNIGAAKIFLSASLALFSAYCIRRFEEDNTVVLKSEQQEIDMDDDEEEKEDGHGPKYDL
jgi:hypothetical protein